MDDKFQNSYEERQPQPKKMGNPFNTELVLLLLLLMVTVAIWTAYALLPISLYRTTIDVCIVLSGMGANAALVLAFGVWFKSN